MPSETHGPKTPRQLYQAAKRMGTWDPEQIDLAQDHLHWTQLSPGQKEQLTKICALFYEGEVSVADTLGWFLLGMQEPDRRMFLSTQILDEVKHAEFFERYFHEILGQVDTTRYLVPEYRGVLLDELRQRGTAIGQAVIAGQQDVLERALVLGVAHYMGVVEGLLAVSGYEYFEEMLGSRGIFPGLLQGIQFIRADEGRHLTHGMDYLRQKLAGHPELAAEVQQLFLSEGMKIPARTDFAFAPNDFGLDKGRMMTIAYSLLGQRQREAGLTA